MQMVSAARPAEGRLISYHYELPTVRAISYSNIAPAGAARSRRAGFKLSHSTLLSTYKNIMQLD